MKVAPDKSISLEWLTGNPEKVIGYTEEEFRSGPVFKFALDVTRLQHRQLLEESYQALMNNERTSTEVLCRRKDGKDVWLRIYRQPIWGDNEQRVVRYYGAVSDITKEKEIEETYREQELLEIELAKEKELRDLRNRYLSTIAHDFRSPLTSISVSNDILKKYFGNYTETQKQTYFDRINRGVAYLDSLLKKLGLLAQAERGYLAFAPEMLSPQEVCAGIVNDFISINNNNHEIIYNCSTMVEECCLDESLLRHILMNLLSNAVKYSPKQSRITLDLSDQDKSLVFKVSDEGIGIPDEDQPRLFDPFYRAGNVGAIKGSGVGLSIVQEMVVVHGGVINFETTAGLGTTFIFTIPIKYGDCEDG
jgi:PAS domain S-box-containing protein